MGGTTGFDWRLIGFDWRAHSVRPSNSRPFELKHVDNNLGDWVVVVPSGLYLTVGIESEGSSVVLGPILRRQILVV